LCGFFCWAGTGSSVVEDALAHGADVASFSRGTSGTALPPEVTQLVGDRETGDYDALRTGEWDAVVDLSGFQTKQVDETMDALGDRVGRYVFISSHAVDVRELPAGTDETAPRRPPMRAPTYSPGTTPGADPKSESG
jgi:hypothetical protein